MTEVTLIQLEFPWEGLESHKADTEFNLGQLRAELEFLEFLVGKGVPDFIDPAHFPSIPLIWLKTNRLFATENAISAFLNAKDISLNPQNQQKISMILTNLIEMKENDFSSGVADINEEINEDLIRAEAIFGQPGEANGALELAIRFGFYDQIHARNFPALRALPPTEIARLKARSLRMRIEDLKDQEANLREDIGFGAKDEIDLRSILREEIKETEKLRRELLLEFTDGQASSDTIEE